VLVDKDCCLESTVLEDLFRFVRHSAPPLFGPTEMPHHGAVRDDY
jgi:hypothetical protein